MDICRITPFVVLPSYQPCRVRLSSAQAQRSTPSTILPLIANFCMSSPHRCATRFLVAPVKKSPSRTLGGRARSAAGSPSRLGRTTAGLAVAESSALLTNTPLAIAGGTGVWDGDAEDPALRSVSPFEVQSSGVFFGGILSLDPVFAALVPSRELSPPRKREAVHLFLRET